MFHQLINQLKTHNFRNIQTKFSYFSCLSRASFIILFHNKIHRLKYTMDIIIYFSFIDAKRREAIEYVWLRFYLLHKPVSSLWHSGCNSGLSGPWQVFGVTQLQLAAPQQSLRLKGALA